MSFINGVFLVAAGLGAMGFGLMIFYALLPLFYGFFGFGVGYWLGSLITSSPPGEMGFVKLVIAIVVAGLFAFAAYALEGYRRILVGIGLGSLLGGLIASALGLTGFFGVLIMVAFGVVGALFILSVYDPLIIVVSALGGAGLAMDGLHLIAPALGIFNRTAIGDGGLVPLLIWIVVGGAAIAWQFSNLARWVERYGGVKESG